MKISFITAGGAGMFCGSCMQDNTLAKALISRGEEVTLVPLYTPLTLDDDLSESSPVFMGGIRLYMLHQYPWFRRMPRWMTKWMDAPSVLNYATKMGVSNDAKQLGALTISMLKGVNGPQKELVLDLVDYVTNHLKPDVIILSNILLSGIVPALRQKYQGKLFGFLQGDDSFLDQLIEPYRSEAMSILRSSWQHYDGYFTYSDYYRRYIANYLSIDPAQINVLPLGIDAAPHKGQPKLLKEDTFTLGYFARIAPEKGFHVALEAFSHLHAKHPHTKFRYGGYLHPSREAWMNDELKKYPHLKDHITHIGSPKGLSEKVRFYNEIDALCVPATFEEPKGLYVLEAIANGVPVVLPSKGAFPELVASTQGGILTLDHDPRKIAEAVSSWINDPNLHRLHAHTGHQRLRSHHTSDKSAEALIGFLNKDVSRQDAVKK
jgi:glycosyltransferase involved in cell wall biosynthesis